MNTPEQAEAIRVVEKTMAILKEKGWCIWTCFYLDNDKIIVAADGFQLPMLKPEYPVYTVKELSELSDKDLSTIKLVHAAKKMTGVTVQNG